MLFNSGALSHFREIIFLEKVHQDDRIKYVDLCIKL